MQADNWAKLVRQVLASTGMTKARLAEIVGTDASTIGRWANGKLKRRPDYDAVIRLGEFRHDVEGTAAAAGYPLGGDDAPPSQVEELSADLVTRARRIEELAREFVREAEEEQRRREVREDEDRRRGA